SSLKAAKKAGRTAADGIVITRIAADGSYGVMVEINSETDFVARDENFLAFANSVVEKAFAGKITAVEDLGVEEARQALVQKIGENNNVRRIQLLEATDGVVDGYVHSNNRIAVLVQLKGGDAALARDVAMHVAASNPQVTRSEDLSQEVIEKEREIYTAQDAESGKPADIVAKKVEGRVRKYVAEVTLTEQAFVKDPE